MPRTLSAVLLCLATVAVYLPTVTAPFVYDDFGFVADNPHIRSLRNIPHFFTDAQTVASQAWRDPIYRPVRTLSYAVGYAIHGNAPAGFRVVNILLHLCAGWMVWRFLARLLDNESLAVALAAIFLLHPVQVDAVTWIASRGVTLSTVFVMAGALLMQKQPERVPVKTIMTCGLLIALAAWTYEAAYVAPALFACAHIAGMGRAPSRANGMRAYAPLFAVACACFIVRGEVAGSMSSFEWWGDSITTTWLTGIATVSRAASVILFPDQLKSEYLFPLSESIGDPYVLAAVGGIVLTALIAIRTRAWLAAMGIAWALVALAPALNILPNSILFGERFLYPPLIGVGLAVGAAVRHSNPRLALPALIVCSVVFGILAHQRTQDFRSEAALWRATYRTYPHLLRFDADLYGRKLQALRSRILRETGKAVAATRGPAAAIPLYEEAARALPHFYAAHMELGLAYLRVGRLQQAEWELVEALHAGPVFDAERVEMQRALGQVYHLLGDTVRAVAVYRHLLEEFPRDARLHSDLGAVYHSRGDFDRAERLYRIALESDPRHYPTRMNLGALYLSADKYAAAVEEFESARDLAPERPDVYRHLALAYRGAGDTRKARAAMERFIEAVPEAAADAQVQEFLESLRDNASE